MKKGILLLFSCGLILSACKNNPSTDSQPNRNTSTRDSTQQPPHTSWNGEYYKIDTLKTEKRKEKMHTIPQRVNMGKATFYIDNQENDIKLFVQKKNVLSFNDESVSAYIQGGDGTKIHVYFTKSSGKNNYAGEYTIGTNGKKKGKILIELNPANGMTYTVQSGAAHVSLFSPQGGKLKLKFQGEARNKSGEKVNCKGTIDMHFNNAIHVG